MASEDDDALLFLIYQHLKVNGYRRAAKALEKHVTQSETEESTNLHDMYAGWMKTQESEETEDLKKRSIKQEAVGGEDESAETKRITVTEDADIKPLIECQTGDVESSSQTDAANETQKETTDSEKIDSSVDDVEEEKEEMNSEKEPDPPEAPAEAPNDAPLPDGDAPPDPPLPDGDNPPDPPLPGDAPPDPPLPGDAPPDPPLPDDDTPPDTSNKKKSSSFSSSDSEETPEHLQHDSRPTQPEENQRQEPKSAENVLVLSDGASATTFCSQEVLSSEEDTAAEAQPVYLNLMAGSEAPPPASKTSQSFRVLITPTDVANQEEETFERTEDPADLVILTEAEDVSIITNTQNDDGGPAEKETCEEAKTPKRKKKKKGTETPRVTDAPWETPLSSKAKQEGEGEKVTPEKKKKTKKRKREKGDVEEQTAATPLEKKIKDEAGEREGVEDSPGESTRRKKKRKWEKELPSEEAPLEGGRDELSEVTDGNSSALSSTKKKKRLRTKLSRRKRLRLQMKDKMMKRRFKTKSNSQSAGQNLTGRKKQKLIQEETPERAEAEQHETLKRRKKKKPKVGHEESSSKENHLPKRSAEAPEADSTMTSKEKKKKRGAEDNPTPAKKTKQDRRKYQVEPDETPPAVSVKKKSFNKK
ncbi:transcript variant X3 [Nothobranchius furzeri]|uniref:Transcript variant X3 n=1 Tax=Nothobranchius furzeri TaxID=105023 RepID=A0A9D2YK27_NOTFU|nr:transcript variant X3 [Nothobranchius furzeri]